MADERGDKRAFKNRRCETQESSSLSTQAFHRESIFNLNEMNSNFVAFGRLIVDFPSFDLKYE
jgi:hypothetical protein